MDNNSIFRADLKLEDELELLKDIGSIFQSRAPLYWIDFMPYWIVFFLCRKRSPLAAILVL